MLFYASVGTIGSQYFCKTLAKTKNIAELWSEVKYDAIVKLNPLASLPIIVRRAKKGADYISRGELGFYWSKDHVDPIQVVEVIKINGWVLK